MKIMYVNPYAGGPGVGRYWRAFHLSREWKNEGHDVKVVLPAYHHLMDGEPMPTGLSRHSGVDYVFLPAIKYSGNGVKRLLAMLLFAATLLWFLLRLPRSERPDLIVYSSAHPFAYPSALVAAKIFRSKIYFEVRDLWPLSLVEIAGINPRHPIVWMLSKIEYLAYRCSDKVISLLPGALEHMAARGLSVDKFIYAPNGFSLGGAASQVITHPLISDLQIFRKNGDFVYFYAGALGEPNAMHKFLDALDYLPKPQARKLRFVIVGKGEQAEALQRRCIERSFDFVSFYEQVDKAVIFEALKCVDAGFFVMHDLPIYRFGVSLNKLYDYMALGVPVVGAYRAFNDPLVEGDCGVSVAPDRPEELAVAFSALSLCDQDVLRAMGQRGQAYLAANFEYAAIAKKILANAERLG